ncbi:MBOAT family O-acyltransferase [Massilibacterium senegalense]|uniref:MBOAT family O-acyltransferase n=1 Tax=Massilibacterium senegalense TaxID=1632858 RepID=UPI0011CC73E5|nr:MBOAT family O-acyltransferase [Massilibacterium senegalense]
MIFVKSNKIKKGFLLVASYYFYAYWDYRFVFLMFIMSLVNYYFGLKIENSEKQNVKKNWLITSVVFNLTILGFFKYFNFFIESANTMLDNFGVRFPYLEIILPVGISFITFEVMSYTIDIYRKTNKSPNNFWDLALLVAFFPHLIAGPILKPKEFFPQLQKEIIIRWSNVEVGIQIFLFGLAKKVLIADRLALFVGPVFDSPQIYSSITIWLAVIAYAIQIYCDFSGYSDMAIGSAKCLGFDIPRNFNMPYVSKSVTEFWRRWHISLSTWLKEYLYISLGGNRKGKVRQYMNLMIVMLLGGLWHGASWNFVIWGGLHGVALGIHKVYMDYIRQPNQKESYMYNFFSWLLTFIFICIAWVFFRSKDFTNSLIIIQKMFFMNGVEGINWYATSLFIIIPVIVIAHFIGKKLGDYAYFKLNTFKGLFVLFFVLFGLLFLTPVNSSPFIYFQF